MKALTIWQPWASLIAEGAKPYEFRRWDYRARQPKIEGQRIVIHAGARPVKRDEVLDIYHRLDHGESALIADRARAVLEKSNDGRSLLLAHGLGTAVLGTPRRATDLFGDSDDIDEEVWGWPLTDWAPFTPPVPCKGAQGFWNWSASL